MKVKIERTSSRNPTTKPQSFCPQPGSIKEEIQQESSVRIVRPGKKNQRTRKISNRLCSKIFKDLCCQVLRDVQILSGKLRELKASEQDTSKEYKKFEDSIFLADSIGYTTMQRNSKQSIRKLLSLLGSHQITHRVTDLKLVQYILLGAIDIYFKNMASKKVLKKQLANTNKQKQCNYLDPRKFNLFSSCEEELLELASVISEIKLHPYYSKIRQLMRCPSHADTIKITGLTYEKQSRCQVSPAKFTDELTSDCTRGSLEKKVVSKTNSFNLKSGMEFELESGAGMEYSRKQDELGLDNLEWEITKQLL